MQDNQTHIIETDADGREVREVSERAIAPETRVTDVRSSATVPRQQIDHLDTVAYDPYEGRRIAGYRLSQLIYWIFGLIEGLILVRLILKVLGANQTAGFAQFIYGITAPLVAPFVGLFSNPAYQSSVLELGSIIALIVYALVAWLLAKLVWILLGETRSAIRTRSTQMDSRV